MNDNERRSCLDIFFCPYIGFKGEVKDVVSHYDHIIVDECHHVSAFTFEQVLRKARARFILGLTATAYRRDSHQPIILMQCGPVRYKVSHMEESAKHPFQHRLICQHTKFTIPDPEAVQGIHYIYARFSTDEERNQMILNDVLHVLEEGRSPSVQMLTTIRVSSNHSTIAAIFQKTKLIQGIIVPPT